MSRFCCSRSSPDTVTAERDRPRGRRQIAKFDKALREASERGGEKLRVIVRTDPRTRAARARQLAQRGQLHAEHALIDSVTATLSTDEIDALTSTMTCATCRSTPWSRGTTDVHAGRRVARQPGVPLRRWPAEWWQFLGRRQDRRGRHRLRHPAQQGSRPGRIDAFYDFTQGGRKVAPFDDYGHGTHVAGLIGGDGELSHERFEGSASKAHFVGFKVLDRNGAGYTSQVLAAIEYAIANRARLKLRILNLSLGHPIYEPAATDPLVQAVERASRAGLIVVVSAGNNGEKPGTGLPGYGGINSPGNAPSAITVGAVDVKMTRSSATTTWSRSTAPAAPRGTTATPSRMSVAPGHRLVASAALQSTLYLGNAVLRVLGDHEKKPAYLRLSGTSMSAAVTSGVIAVLLEVRDSRYPTRPADREPGQGGPSAHRHRRARRRRADAGRGLHQSAGRRPPG